MIHLKILDDEFHWNQLSGWLYYFNVLVLPLICDAKKE